MVDLTKHYLISGRVQGVGFRAFASRQAQQLGLKGWVRNLADGRVEAVASGSPPDLTNFEAWLRQGPTQGHVDLVEVGECGEVGQLDHFEVRKDGLQPCV